LKKKYVNIAFLSHSGKLCQFTWCFKADFTVIFCL